jgi:isoquinoline 1-oxidoreductase beta subunit
MSNEFDKSRREFIRVTAASGSGLTIAMLLGFSRISFSSSHTNQNFRPNAWLTIFRDNSVELILSESEMGQGVMTSMPMLIAEELEVDWETIRVLQAPVDPVYGWQGTGGSRSVREGWEPLRQAGATARDMLVTAAAQLWNVTKEECRTQNSEVIHIPTGWRTRYGDLVLRAAQLPLPEQVPLKDPKEFRLIGQPVPRLDAPSKVDGTAVFGIDVTIPNMLITTIIHCPVFGGKTRSVNAESALAVDGVRHVVPLESAVAVVADDFWSAYQGKQKLDIKWDYGEKDQNNSEEMQQMLRDAAKSNGRVVRREGDVEAALANTARQITADYETSLQAHATMEPMCCTAHVHDGGCDVWAPTQQPTAAQKEAHKWLGTEDKSVVEKLRQFLKGGPEPTVNIHTTLLGGGFGRRNIQDFVGQSVRISKAVKAPVKLIWSREEDMQHDYYNPATHHRLTAALGEDGRLIAWYHRLTGSRYAAGAKELPYAIPNIQVEASELDVGVSHGPWRSVAHSYNAFAIECFIDELAIMAKQDPVEYRLALLTGAPRHKRVLELAANKASWGRTLPEGHFQGVALHASFGSYVAQVVELSIDKRAGIKVHRVICAVDCGICINPDTVKAQIEGAIVYGLTATLKSHISIQNGRVEQSNFDDFPLLRFDEMPQIETFILPSEEQPGGIGEPGVPPIAPAVVNALYAATGARFRRLPILPKDIVS